MPRVRFSPNAKTDLRGIAEYIGQENLAAANRQVAKIRKKCKLLGRHPGLGERCDFISAGCRRTFVGNYVIFYRHDETLVEVVRIFRGERDIRSI